MNLVVTEEELEHHKYSVCDQDQTVVLKQPINVAEAFDSNKLLEDHQITLKFCYINARRKS